MKIECDYREKGSGVIDLLAEEDIQLVVKTIQFGDYCINDSLTIERKTARDFLQSIADTRLFKQLSNMKKYCDYPVVLIEGNPFKTGMNFRYQAIRGALLSIQTIWHIPVIFSRSKNDTRNIFMMIGTQQEKCMNTVPLRGVYKPRKLKSGQLYLLQGMPQIGPRLAKRLMQRFGSVQRVMNASVDELKKVEGIGLISAQKIRDLLESPWEKSRVHE